MKNRFTTTDLSPLIKLALPLALTSMLQSAIFFCETIFLAHLGTDYLAAGSLVGWLSGTLTVIFMGTLSSINILISHHYGAKDHSAISQVLRDGLMLAVGLSLLGFILLWNAGRLFLVFGQSPEIVQLSNAYLHAMAWGLLPNYLILALLEFIIGLGHTRIILAYTILSAFFTILFSYLFIFGKLGLPALKIAGAGWGMTLSNWLMVFIFVAYLLNNKTYQAYFKAILKRAKVFQLGELLQLGFPIGLMYCIEVGFFFALTLVMGSLGSSLLAANQITLQYMCLLMNVAFALAQAVTVRMGHLLGARDLNSAGRVIFSGLSLSAALMGTVALVYWFFPGALIAVDLDVHDPANAEIVHQAKQFFAVCALFQIVEASRICLFGALRALKDTRFTLFISIFSFWAIALPLGYEFAVYLHLGGVGLWWGMVLGAGFSVALLHWRFTTKIKRKSINIQAG